MRSAKLYFVDMEGILEVRHILEVDQKTSSMQQKLFIRGYLDYLFCNEELMFLTHL